MMKKMLCVVIVFVLKIASTSSSSSSPDESTGASVQSVQPTWMYVGDLLHRQLEVIYSNLDVTAIDNLYLFNRDCHCTLNATMTQMMSNASVKYNITSSSSDVTPGKYYVFVTYASHKMESNVSLEVVRDPEIVSVMPKTVFLLGGVGLTLSGSGFERAGQARIEVRTTTDKSIVQSSQPCSFQSDTSMVCILPLLNIDQLFGSHDNQPSKRFAASRGRIKRSANGNARIQVSLILQHHHNFLQFDQLFEFTTKRPWFRNYSGVHYYGYYERSYIIYGRDILLGCSESDYAVRLGTGSCPLLRVNNETISCSLPSTTPQPSKDDQTICDQESVPLIVQLGRYKETSTTAFIQCVKYRGPDNLPLALGLGIGLGLFVLLLLVLTVGLMIFFIRRSHNSTKQLAWEHNNKAVQEFLEKSKKFKNSSFIPAILQLSANIQREQEKGYHTNGQEHQNETDSDVQNAGKTPHKSAKDSSLKKPTEEGTVSKTFNVHNPKETDEPKSTKEYASSDSDMNEGAAQNLLIKKSPHGKDDVSKLHVGTKLSEV